MRNLLLSIVAVLVTGVSSLSQADPLVEVGAYESQSFSPSNGESFAIPLTLTSPDDVGKLEVEIRTQDGDVVSKIPVEAIESADLTVIWDGKDNTGRVVPNEAYSPLIILTRKNGDVVKIDPGEGTGGEEVYKFEKTINTGSIEYDLPVASRMLIRSGIRNGPMLRTILDWEPRTSGFHAERWNGMDGDGIAVLEQMPEIGYLIMGYRLPDHAIITYGNTQQSYRAYREANNWPIRQADAVKTELQRNDNILRQEYFYPVLQQKSPRTLLRLLDVETKEPVTQIKGFQDVIAEVKLDPLDELYLDQERYEVSFFVDHQFISEEERGYVPITWRWSPGRLGLEPGKHILTVNVSGYKGQVGVKNLSFEYLQEN